MKLKKLLSLVLTFVILTLSLYTAGSVSAEEKTYTGSVNVNSDSYLTVRKEPAASSAELGRLAKGEKVTIHGGKIKGVGGDTREWYKIEFETSSGGFGYVAASYVKDVSEIIPPVEYVPDATFEENLEKQGFPESYKVLLRQLHAAHPSWIFLADHINLTWDEVLKTESAVGKSLVSTSRPDSYKSMEYGAYNWTTKTYVGFDGTSWVSADRDIVAYYLEPRNFLNEGGIFQFLDQSYNASIQNIEGVKKIIENSFMAEKFPESTHESYAALLMEAGEKSKVSPYVLAAMIIQEQGRKGTSGSISGTYSNELKGFYNHFNIGAYATGSLTAVQRGLMYARGDFVSDAYIKKYGLPWTSRAKSIIGGSIWFGSGYIEVGQDTLYYKKWDLIGPNYYNHQYMTNVQAGYSESVLMKEAYADMPADTVLTFSIPVFKNMPEENKTALPTSNGANNYYLEALSAEKASISPSFNMYNFEYETVVEYNVPKITVSATPVTGATVVSGAGSHELKVGDNEIKITVKAASGKTKDYILHVTRKEGEGEIIPDPEIDSKLTFGTYLSGIEPGTTVDALKSKITVKDGSFKLLDSKGKEKTSGTVVTGDKITVYRKDNTEFMHRNVVIYGDISGDGKISIIDLANVQKHILKVKTQDGVFFTAADTNRDGKISIIDLANVQKHILKVKLIKQ